MGLPFISAYKFTTALREGLDVGSIVYTHNE